MKQLPSVVIAFTLIFACQIKLTFTQFQRYINNPFLPPINDADRANKPQVLIWTDPERSPPTTFIVKPRLHDYIPRRLPTIEEGCGRIPAAPYVAGGRVAKNGNYPWIALLIYGEDSNFNPKCAGSLITARHVVTAAHCIREDLSFARLGEHDTTTDADSAHVDVPIVKTAIYPHYNRLNKRGDIAILYLERNVNNFQPICMPHSPNLRSQSHVGRDSLVAGWGSTYEGGKPATVLRVVNIFVLNNEVCRHSYSKLYRNYTEDQFDKAIVCAGVLEGGKDSCQGDSGGPLMTAEYPKLLIGIVSYGIGCGKPGVPGVYASTQYFMDWIVEMVKNTP
ncbi:venom protease-like [Drosophila innubila]|uniref:venom protease-like n=1 Tax=Drosophila innubila TaxID=198719 RepID=UPI00148CBD28|nr:venom protease-like [Drosophila innubila]